MCLSHAHSLCETSHNPTRTLPERAFIHFCQNAASILARVELMKLEHHLANPAARSRQALLTADAVSQAEGNHPTHVGVPKTQRWSPIERTRGSDRPINSQTRHFICLLPTPRIVSLDRGGVSNLPEGDFAKIPSAIFYKKNLPFSPFWPYWPLCWHEKQDRDASVRPSKMRPRIASRFPLSARGVDGGAGFSSTSYLQRHHRGPVNLVHADYATNGVYAAYSD